LGFLGKAGSSDVNVGFSLYNVVGWCLTNVCELACDQPVSEGMSFSGVSGLVRALGGHASVDPYLPGDLVLEGSTPAPDAGTVSSQPDAPSVVVPDAPLPEPDAPPAAATVAAVAKTPPADGTEVTLASVVVVGNELRSSGSQVYVQDPGGGPWSGLLVYCGTATCKPSLAALQPGDVIAVTGNFKAFKSGGGTTLELGEPLTVTPSGASAAPVAVDVAPDLLPP